ncbi:MAG: hypothetical protein KGO02_17940 [Alphaproteobacteria bacterium]|nr:hypothetical protein [Alphaproteobacteria bacterium]
MGDTTNLELMKMLAKTVAEETVREMLDQVQGQISEQIDRQFKTYFGDMSASKHAIEHSRIEKLLDRMDKISDNFWGQVVGTIIKWGLGIFVAGSLLWHSKAIH